MIWENTWFFEWNNMGQYGTQLDMESEKGFSNDTGPGNDRKRIQGTEIFHSPQLANNFTCTLVRKNSLLTLEFLCLMS